MTTHPISFSIPGSKFVPSIGAKQKLLSSLIPGELHTYIYETETDYYAEYQKSIFAVTKLKGGWDCLRHYEIVANGAIPLFERFEQIPAQTMTNWPRSLQARANDLFTRVRQAHPEGNNADMLSAAEHVECRALAEEFLAYGREHFSCATAAQRILDLVGANGSKVLYLSSPKVITPEYLRCLTLLGFKELFGTDVHDYPRIPHLYTDCPIPLNKLYGKGMTYSKLLLPELHDSSRDTSLEADIAAHYYDLVVYATHEYDGGDILLDLVRSHYKTDEIVFFCGRDLAACTTHMPYGHTFVREAPYP
jgi:hypothetical protein